MIICVLRHAAVGQEMYPNKITLSITEGNERERDEEVLIRAKENTFKKDNKLIL